MQDSVLYIIIQTFHCRWKIIECIDICIGYSFLIFSEVRMWHMRVVFTSGECNTHHICTRSHGRQQWTCQMLYTTLKISWDVTSTLRWPTGNTDHVYEPQYQLIFASGSAGAPKQEICNTSEWAQNTMQVTLLCNSCS